MWFIMDFIGGVRTDPGYQIQGTKIGLPEQG